MKYDDMPIRLVNIKYNEYINAGEEQKQLEFWSIDTGNAKTTTLENWLPVSYKLKHMYTLESNNTIIKYLP
jgi:hypothetical protein